MILNDPTGPPERVEGDDWTPARGLRRGAGHGFVAAVVLAVLLAPVAMHLPYMIIILWLRVPLALGVAWLLCEVVHRAAGMIDTRCGWLALLLATLVLISQHVVFALHGVPAVGDIDSVWVFPVDLLKNVLPYDGDVLRGWAWFHPYALLALNAVPLVLGGGFGVALSRRG